MAAPIPTVTVNFDIPMLAQLVQSNNDLRREVSGLRTQLSTRLNAIEVRLPQLTTRSQELDYDPTVVHEDPSMDENRRVGHGLDVQGNNFADQDIHALNHHEDEFAQERGPAPEHDSAQDSSPSVDEGITVAHRASPPPAHGRKRKRTVKPVAGKSPYINHSGFVVRSSDNQLAERRNGEPRPLRSESPVDSNEDVQESSDRLDIIPPTRPQSKARASPPNYRAQRPQTVVDDADGTATDVPQEITLRYDHCSLDLCSMLIHA